MFDLTSLNAWDIALGENLGSSTSVVVGTIQAQIKCVVELQSLFDTAITEIKRTGRIKNMKDGDLIKLIKTSMDAMESRTRIIKDFIDLLQGITAVIDRRKEKLSSGEIVDITPAKRQDMLKDLNGALNIIENSREDFDKLKAEAEKK